MSAFADELALQTSTARALLDEAVRDHDRFLIAVASARLAELRDLADRHALVPAQS